MLNQVNNAPAGGGVLSLLAACDGLLEKPALQAVTGSRPMTLLQDGWAERYGATCYQHDPTATTAPEGAATGFSIGETAAVDPHSSRIQATVGATTPQNLSARLSFGWTGSQQDTGGRVVTAQTLSN